MSQQNVETVRASLDAWNRRDPEAWLESAHPEVEWISEIARQVEGPGTVYRGKEELRRFWDDWHSAWDVRIEITDFRDLGDTIVALGRIRTLGEASGIRLERPIAYVFEFDDKGLARRVRAYLDQQRALEAVGLSD